MIENAQISDAPEIAALWNYYVETTTATFRSAFYDAAEVEALINTLTKDDKPFLIARNETLLGFALYKQFRGGDGYARTMEHSIYLDISAQGRGIGRKLMEALEKHARFRNVHCFIGGVTADNAESIRFHERLGFRMTGMIPEVAEKFGRKQDIAFMQKILKD